LDLKASKHFKGDNETKDEKLSLIFIRLYSIKFILLCDKTNVFFFGAKSAIHHKAHNHLRLVTTMSLLA